jgi:tRNA threonylcarbamoyladenosine biosynthesis protein TsaE
MNPYLISTSAMMEAFGNQLAPVCQVGTILHLQGELGVGKTTLVRGFLRALGHTGAVKSPTYTLVEPYQINGRKIYHFDFYRLAMPEELEYMGIRDYLTEDILMVIEWPERGGEFTPAADLQIQLFYYGQTERLLQLQALTAIGQTIAIQINQHLKFASQSG